MTGGGVTLSRGHRGGGHPVAWPKTGRDSLPTNRNQNSNCPPPRLTHRRVSSFPCFLHKPRMCYSLDGFRPCSRSTAHGMGYPSTRRDRPELRNQLVRQRRAVIHQSNFLSGGRFPHALNRARKWTPFIFLPRVFSNTFSSDRSDRDAH